MQRNLVVGMIALGVGALLAGCSAGPAEPAEPAGPPEITGAESLREAYVSAGGSCDDWNHHDSGTLSSESGSCGEKTALSFFDDAENMELQLFTFDKLELGYLSGKDWVINTTEFGDDQDASNAVAQKMGGTYTPGK